MQYYAKPCLLCEYLGCSNCEWIILLKLLIFLIWSSWFTTKAQNASGETLGTLLTEVYTWEKKVNRPFEPVQISWFTTIIWTSYAIQSKSLESFT